MFNARAANAADGFSNVDPPMRIHKSKKMKTKFSQCFTRKMLATACLLWFAASCASAAVAKTNRTTTEHVIDHKVIDPENKVVVKVVTAEDEDDRPAKDRAWLGVGVEEAPEALADQLGLDAGTGLVVTQVSADSPAAKVGLRRNDVLIELEGQSLVHPAQLRKLVQARTPGDKVKVVYYRGGKRHTETAALEQAPARLGLLDEGVGEETLRQLRRELLELSHSEALHAQIKTLSESLRPFSEEVMREFETALQGRLEQARKAIAEAAREVDHNKDSLRAESARLKELLKGLLKSGVSVDDNATVVVRSKGNSSRSIVKTDDSGTIVVVGPPNLHLTAHDKSGKLIFDGEIATSEQRASVPADLWQRVEPLLDEKSDTALEPKKKEP